MAFPEPLASQLSFWPQGTWVPGYFCTPSQRICGGLDYSGNTRWPRPHLQTAKTISGQDSAKLALALSSQYYSLFKEPGRRSSAGFTLRTLFSGWHTATSSHYTEPPKRFRRLIMTLSREGNLHYGAEGGPRLFCLRFITSSSQICGIGLPSHLQPTQDRQTLLPPFARRCRKSCLPSLIVSLRVCFGF
jgi:hypothetical protein